VQLMRNLRDPAVALSRRQSFPQLFPASLSGRVMSAARKQ